jgi:hypothetical protein
VDVARSLLGKQPSTTDNLAISRLQGVTDFIEPSLGEYLEKVRQRCSPNVYESFKAALLDKVRVS